MKRRSSLELAAMSSSSCAPVPSPVTTKRFADILVSSFERPLELPGGGLEALGVSVGVALYPRDGQDGESLLKAADQALYRVKRTGGGAALTAKATNSLTDSFAHG